MTHMSAFYTKEFARRVAEAIEQEFTHGMLVKEMGGDSQLCASFGTGTMCVCV